MAWSRNKYHYGIRSAKKLADSMRARELLDAATSGDMYLLDEMKKSMMKKDLGQATPENFE